MAEPIPRGPFDQGLFLAHYNKGRELFEAQRFDEAERQLEEAYLLRPRDARVLNLLGLVYYRSEKLGKAEEVYRKLIAESPEVHTLHYNLGLVCFKLGRLEDAEAAFQKAVELTQGNPKIHFYLGSIYERLHRYKDAIYQYRQAGANMLVQRLEGRMSGAKPPATARPAVPPSPLPVAEADPGTKPPTGKKAVADTAAAEVAAALDPMVSKTIQPVSPTLMAGDSLLPGDGALSPDARSTRRFKGHDDTLPPALRMAAGQRAAAPGSDTKPGTGSDARPSEVFRALERGLMEISFAGKVYIKQGTIYSYSGNLTFWVKDKRPGARPSLVIVTGTGRLILTDQERELTFTRVMDEPVYVEPSHLVACEESLQPRYIRLGDDSAGLEIVALEGRGMVALSVASKPLPLGVSPGMPVSVPAHSVIMWTGALVPHVVDDPAIYAVVMASAGGQARMLRLEGTGQILVEQAVS
jgi:Tfp pilus assembly protein PilF